MQRESIYEKITNADLQRFSDNNNIFISEYHIKYGFKNTYVIFEFYRGIHNEEY